MQDERERQDGLMQSELPTDAGTLPRTERLVSVHAILGLTGGEPVGIETLGARPHAWVALQQREHHKHPLSGEERK